jgi:hypothetical protein
MRRFVLMLLPGVVACSSGAPQAKLDSAPHGDHADSANDTGGGNDPCVEGWEVGMCPPDFTLVDASNELRSLSDLRGQPILVLGTAEW